MNFRDWFRGTKSDEDENAFPENEGETTTIGISKNDDISSEIEQSIYKNQERKADDVFTTGGSALQYKLFKPMAYDEEIGTIADQLKDDHTILLNLEDTPTDGSRRIFDFLSGVAYAKGGCVEQISARSFLITPNQVDFEADTTLVISDII